MLARRFAIVCLLTMLFGMGFAILVAESSRSTPQWEDMRNRNCGVLCSNLPHN